MVRVPVLSMATRVMSASFSIATPPRNRMPRRAPAAMPARMAEGMDSTRAQGDATTSSVMLRRNASAAGTPVTFHQTRYMPALSAMTA